MKKAFDPIIWSVKHRFWCFVTVGLIKKNQKKKKKWKAKKKSKENPKILWCMHIKKGTNLCFVIQIPTYLEVLSFRYFLNEKNESLNFWNFALPVTHSFKTTFDFN